MLNSNSVKNIHPIINRAKEKSNALFHFTPLPGARDNNSALKELVVTDTIPLSEVARVCPKIRQISVAEMLAETMRRIAFGESVSSMYVD